MFTMLTGATLPILALVPMLFILFTPTGSATTSRAALRRAIRRPHPLSVHSIYDPVELFDDAIETAGGVSCLGGMLVHGPFFGRPHRMHPARHDGEHRHTSRDRQPFQ
jgi:hypothetical protein